MRGVPLPDPAAHCDPARLVRVSRLEEGSGQTTRRSATRCSPSRPTRSTRSRSSRNQAIARRCGKKGSDWEIVQPISAPTDQAAVSGITSNLSSVEIQRVIDENPPDLKEFGLAAPRVEVAFKASGQQHRLQLGQKTPAGTDVYAKLPDSKRVFLIPSFLDSTFNKSTFDLQRQVGAEARSREGRQPRGHDEGPHDSDSQKKNGEWQIAQPAAGRAEFSAVDGLVSRVSSVQMKSIVPDATRPEEVRARQAGRDGPARFRARRRHRWRSAVPPRVGSVYAKDLSRPARLHDRVFAG